MNSRVLLVTSIKPLSAAIEAICKSSGPIRDPANSATLHFSFFVYIKGDCQGVNMLRPKLPEFYCRQVPSLGASDTKKASFKSSIAAG